MSETPEKDSVGQGLVNEEPRRPGRPRMSDAERVESEARRRAANIELGKQRTALANSIGKIPKCKNPRRRERAEKSLQTWIDTYLISLFTNDDTGEHWPWSTSQIDSMRIADHVLIHGGQFIKAMRRGGFKTGLIKAAAMKGLLTGVRKFCAGYAASDKKARRIFESIKKVISLSVPLREDYPEVCYPIWRLKARKAAITYQTYTFRGQELPTYITWSAEKVILPDIEGSPSRQGIFCTFGLTGSETRGLLETTADLKDRRPDLLLFDDVETDESAESEIQAPGRLKLVNVALESGAPGVPIAAFYAGTVIGPESVCAKLLVAPGWKASVSPAMPTMPLHCSETPAEIEHRDLWGGEYFEALNLRDPIEARSRANDIYARYRAKAECLPILDQKRPCETCDMRDRCMDAGAIVDWVQAKDPNQLSAIQFCMDKFILKPDTFFTEFQQAPRAAKDIGIRMLPQQIMQRVNGYGRRVVPASCVLVTCGIDVQKSYLPFVIVAWEPDFTGYVIDYGTWPDQGRRIFYKINPPHPMRLDFPDMEEDAMIQAAVKSHLLKLKGLDFPMADGRRFMQIGKGLIDSRYGTKPVYSAIRMARWGGVFEPCKGKGFSGGKQIDEYDTKKEGWWVGDNCYRPPVKGTQESPHVSIGVDHYKTDIHKAFSLATGSRGGMSLWGADSECRQHELFAAHAGGSEKPSERKTDSGRAVSVWEEIPGGAENDLFDALVYARNAASLTGMVRMIADIKTREMEPPRVRRPMLPAKIAGRRFDSIYS